MKKLILPIFGGLLLHATVVAQDDIPLLRPEEREAVDAQTEEFNRSLTPALTTAAKSTVRVWGAGSKHLAYGTVIGDGRRFLTKWSEVSRSAANLRVEAPGGGVRSVKISGVYEDEDLAVLETSGPALTPVKWSKELPKLGGFLAASQPDGRPAAFGVVSVLERNLRDTDQAFLGVISAIGFTGPGVKIHEVAPDSGAAEEELVVAYGDERLEIGFNAKYLLEIASQVDRENAVFLFNSSGDPTPMREGNDMSAVYVVMPMRV